MDAILRLGNQGVSNDHDILCPKLIKYNFPPLAVKWFKFSKDQVSEPSIVRYGVPQGSTL